MFGMIRILLVMGLLTGIGSLAPACSAAVEPLELTGEQRTWLEDGDSVVLRGWCEKPGAARVGFGECEGTLLPARKL